MTSRPTEEHSGSVSRRGFLQTVVGSGIGLLSASALPASGQAALPNPEAPPGGSSDPAKSEPAATPPLPADRAEVFVHTNQVGYLPDEAKRAIVAASGPLRHPEFHIIDDDITPEVRFQGTLSEVSAADPNPALGRYFCADFTAFDRPGRYRLRLPNGRLSAPFAIGKDIYGRLVPPMMRYFDIQCCGETRIALRARCHGDDGTAVGGPRDGQFVDASGGWHDAGDYLKFVETTSFVTALMLFAHEHFPKAFVGKAPNSPLPLLLDQARVGLDWLLKMHPTPEEFYYQVGSAADHNKWRLPEQDCTAYDADWKPRPVYFGVGANLAGRTAAALAMASRLYRHYDPSFARRCLSAAQSAYQLGLDNQQILSTLPQDFYPEKTWADDMEWGAAALFQATGQARYLRRACEFAQAAGPAYAPTSVYDTHALAHYTLYPHAPGAIQKRLLEYLRADADYVNRKAAGPYGLGASYCWGTAEAAAGAAFPCLLTAALTKERTYADVARWQRDFVLGCNPFGLCCLIGAGSRYALFPHHQIADLDRMQLSGALIGGPADLRSVRSEKMALDGIEFSVPVPAPLDSDALPDTMGVYQDRVENYVTNEPANDYTVKFLLLTAFYIVSA